MTSDLQSPNDTPWHIARELSPQHQRERAPCVFGSLRSRAFPATRIFREKLQQALLRCKTTVLFFSSFFMRTKWSSAEGPYSPAVLHFTAVVRMHRTSSGSRKTRTDTRRKPSNTCRTFHISYAQLFFVRYFPPYHCHHHFFWASVQKGRQSVRMT